MNKPTDHKLDKFAQLEEISNIMEICGMNESRVYNNLFQIACSDSSDSPATINRLSHMIKRQL